MAVRPCTCLDCTADRLQGFPVLKLPLHNSESTLVDDGNALWVESPVGTRYPVDLGVVSFTSRCNLDCVMCLEPHDAARAVDVPFDEALRLVEIFAGRVPKLWSCAGEALLHPRFFELALASSSRGTPVGVGTNGLVLGNPEMLRRCHAAGVKWLHISCHTSRPERFAALCGRSQTGLFETFVRALDNVDAWNREHEPADRFEVVLQLVLMRGLAQELDEWFTFIAKHLANSPLLVRVETMRLQAAAQGRPDLALSIDELSEIVGVMLERYSGRFTLEFKSVPLCLLAGREDLSEDVRAVARRSLQVGNIGLSSDDLQLMCPIGDPAKSGFAQTCSTCGLAPLCPGVIDVPVESGSPWPRPSAATPETVLARSGIAPDYRRRDTALDFPASDRSTDHTARPGGLRAEWLGVDTSADRQFATDQRSAVERVIGELRAQGLVEDAVLEGHFAAVRLRGGAGIVVLQPNPVAPRFFEVEGVAVRYNGDLTDALRSALDTARRCLQRSAGDV